jgi:3-dehydroquinate synthase/2-deoxy-scyllo-inosose synthase
MASIAAQGVGSMFQTQLRIGASRLNYLMTADIRAFVDQLQGAGVDRWIVVTTAGDWADPRLEEIAGALGASAPVTVLKLAESEQSKTLETVEWLAREAVRAGTTRASCFVGVGGGVICNLTGMCAALLYRGLKLVQVPTTLLAMTDAVISLKQAVNAAGVKNGLGTYHSADVIWANPAWLVSLDAAAVRAGLAEIIKNALVISPHHLAVLKALLRPEGGYDGGEIAVLVRMALESKQQVLEHDPAERGRALALEYGHTVAHALEILTDGMVTHGIGVGYGMRVSARVAREMGMLDDTCVSLHDELLAAAGLQLRLEPATSAALSIDGLRCQLEYDNKRGYIATAADELAMVLITAPGAPQPRERPLTKVPIDLVANLAMEHLR